MVMTASSIIAILMATEGPKPIYSFRQFLKKVALSELEYQGVYFEVRVECSNPDVPKIDSVFYKSELNFPREYKGPKDSELKFQYRCVQLRRYKRVYEQLRAEALEAQKILKAEFKSKMFTVRVIQRRQFVTK